MCYTPNRFQLLLIAATRNRQPDRENVYANTRMTRANANWSGGNPCEFLQKVGSARRHLHFENFARQLRYPLETVVVPDNRVRPADSLELLCLLPLGNFRQPCQGACMCDTPNCFNSLLLQPEIGSPIEKRMCKHACDVGKTLTDQVATLVNFFKELVQHAGFCTSKNSTASISSRNGNCT